MRAAQGSRQGAQENCTQGFPGGPRLRLVAGCLWQGAPARAWKVWGWEGGRKGGGRGAYHPHPLLPELDPSPGLSFSSWRPALLSKGHPHVKERSSTHSTSRQPDPRSTYPSSRKDPIVHYPYSLLLAPYSLLLQSQPAGRRTGGRLASLRQMERRARRRESQARHTDTPREEQTDNPDYIQSRLKKHTGAYRLHAGGLLR